MVVRPYNIGTTNQLLLCWGYALRNGGMKHAATTWSQACLLSMHAKRSMRLLAK